MSGVLTACFAALAAWLVVPSGNGRRRLGSGRRPSLPGWLEPVPGAWSWRVRAGLGVGLGVAAWVSLGGGVLGFGVGAVGGLVLAVATGRMGGRAEQRRREQLVVDLPQALDLLISCLEAGLPLRLATTAVAQAWEGPVADALAAVAARVAVGAPESEAWRSLADVPVLGPVARDVARSLGSGTMLVPTLRRHADDARADRAAHVQSKARTVGVSSVVPLMACFLPAFLLAGVVPIVAGVALRLLAPS